MKHLLFLAAHADSIIWEAVVFIGIPSALLDIALFYAAFLKLRFYLRTRHPLDGLSGLAVLFVVLPGAVALISFPVQAVFPKIILSHHACDVVAIMFYVGFFGMICLRPYTRFAKPKAAVQDGEIKTVG